MDTFEKRYKEALERAKSFQEKYGGDYAGYIFPELREDERIRKFLVDYFASYKIGNVTTKLNGVRIDDILTYLEKQKEQEWNKKPCLTCQEYEKGHKQGYTEGCTAGYNKAMKEQKPAEWSELQSEFKNINEAFEDGKKEVIAHPEKYGLCKPAEWSEEDEEMLEYIIGDVNDAKQLYTTQAAKDMTDKEIAWLKSLRPQGSKDSLQTHWKPSEEQMEILLNTEGMVRASGYRENAKVLASLYEQLKKL